MMRILSGLVPLSIVLACSGAALVVGGQERAIAADYIATATQKISRQTTLPVLLPSESSFQKFLQSDNTTYVTVKSLSNRDYTVNFGDVPNCDANACLSFSISASWGKEIDDSKPNTRDSAYEFIQLSDGTKALATKGCGASCWGRVQWKYKGALYQVWGKARDYDVIVAIANSAMSAGDRSKSSVQTADNRSAQSIAKLPDGTYFYGQSSEVNQVGKMYYLFKKRGDQATGLAFAPRAGDSSCFTGTIQDNQIKRVTVAFASYDRSGKNANWSSNQVSDYNFNGTYRLDVNQYRGDVKDEISRCQSGIAQVVAPSQPSSNSSPNYPSQNEINAIIAEARSKHKSCTDRRSCPKNPDQSLPTDGGEFRAAWMKADPSVARFLGSWYIGSEFLLDVYPSKLKGKVCVLGSGDARVFGFGEVNGKTLRYQDFIAYSPADGYSDRSSQPAAELYAITKPDLLVYGVHSSKGLAFATSFAMKPFGDYENRFQAVFDKAKCTLDLPEGAIAKPIEPLTPIAASNTYAYPSPQEFAQFKKTLKPSPVGLSAADRKLRQDFQTEWQKKNPAIGPYVGAWKTADNQDIYVFPSSQAGRACVVEKKDGEFRAAIGVSMTADMRYSLTHGQFRVAGMTDVVAGRSDKSQPLSALYAAIGSPDVSSSVKEDLAQAKCVAELPKGGAIGSIPKQ
jgi:hypothetical protein